MPIKYKLEEDGTLVLADAAGVLTADCFLSMQKEMREDPGLRSPHRTLLDVTHATDIQVTEEDLEKIARNLSVGPKKLGAEKLAIVANQQQAFRLGTKYGKTDKDVRETVIVFSQIEIARTWLRISRPLGQLS